MKWLVDGYILNIHFVYDALSDTLTFDGQSNSIGLTGDKSHVCDVVREKIYCGTKYVRDVNISGVDVTADNFAFNINKTVTTTKALQINNFVNTLYSRWQKLGIIRSLENPINESWTDYYNYCKWYTSLVTTFSNFIVQNYIKIQDRKPFKDIEGDINKWLAYIKEKYRLDLYGRYDKSFNKINNIEDFFRTLMFFCSDFKISGYVENGWNEELKFVDRGLVL